MNFDNYIINESDYKFFGTLTNDEQLLFLYEVIFDNLIEKSEQFNIENDTTSTDIKSKLFDNLEFMIKENFKVNVIFINKFLIINSESNINLDQVLLELIHAGFILLRIKKTELPEYLKSIYSNYIQYSNYKLYIVVRKTNKICLN
jgi:hypothetical protein